jgi:glycosyltransferase involved in cell wall biosynthesis
MTVHPSISVITPVYKGVRFLRKTFASMQTQTFQDWEWILVDDESKDGSGALVDEFAASDARLRVIHQKNGGTSVARNTALAAARGKAYHAGDEPH